MAEPVFRTLESLVKIAVAAAGTKIAYHGLENIPEQGGAVAAINHTSYIDWLPAALAAHYRHRRMRFMIKEEMRQVQLVSYLIRHTGTIPVNRSAGAHAYAVAVERLKAGELVGVYPEATISRAFELKEFKSGAARMAREARAPIIPIIVWGAQRIWTKDHPKNLRRRKIPLTVHVGGPLYADDSVEHTDAVLRESMTALLQRAQQEYPHPAGAFWVPRRMGGSAPTLLEARALDDAELAERARKRAERA
ncbi:lysophospholipid acyltransferase family protein [Mycobacterium sp.]|uniref:lysophospholipid acyltransferase family protein n=1 Tax=Mycobacterium sp. TaxID=1785 RepID=UPI002C856CCB|nr:lysophospholipid acyltransferase family protein [Mycobacterium sp.]HME47065.1 lysophospholipid acyltransferase family protein [Mycobacterium sp.]